jgi:hypothetical protein
MGINKSLLGRFAYKNSYSLEINIFGGDAEAVEALVCKTGLSGFESRRYLHF